MGDIISTYRNRTLPALCILLSMWAGSANASETDQFMLWGEELEDCSPELNAWMNDQLDEFIVLVNSEKKWQDATIEEITVGYYKHMFSHLLYAKVRAFFRESETIDEFPKRDEVSIWKYQRISIYRGRSFPYILPMARTVRVGEVYLGTDKISHMLGYGRRYFEKYIQLLDRGYSEQEARKKVIRWGLRREMSVVGRVVDGVVSYGDLEANYQGMEMAIAMCHGNNPLFIRDGESWQLARRVNILDYITPDLDETYNNSHYWLLRKRFVIPRLEEHYVERYDDEDVRARHAVYQQWEPSLNMQIIDQYWEEKGRDPRDKQSIQALYNKRYNTNPVISD